MPDNFDHQDFDYEPWVQYQERTLRGTKFSAATIGSSGLRSSSGFVFRGEYRGHDFYSMNGLSNYFTQLGMKAEFRWAQGVASLTVTDATQQVLIDKMGIGVDEERPGIFE